MKTKTLLVSSAAALLAALPVLADVREGLVAYWPLDTASGGFPMTTPEVVAGNDMTGPNKDGFTALVEGRFGQAVTFAGNLGDYLVFATPSGADTGLPVANNGSWTWALWVKGASNQANQTTYFCESSSVNSSGNPRFAMEGNGADKTRYFIRDINGTVKNQGVGAKPTLDDTWHHVAYTYDLASGRFLAYVDGQPDGTNTFTYAMDLPTWNQVAIGALVRNNVAVPFAGSVDDVALWARALSQSEIQEVMTNSIATPVPEMAPTVSVHPKGATNLYPGDAYRMSAYAYGTRPLYYQWQKDGLDLAGANLRTLDLVDLTPADSGDYTLVVSSWSGSGTSLVAKIVVNDYAAPNLTNGLVAYWPLDTIAGVKTPDLVSAYDMTLGAPSGAPLATLEEGKWGQAMRFDAAHSQFARVIYKPGDALPAYTRSNFTVSFWAKAPAAAQGWAFAEASTLNNNPAFALGQLGSDGKLDIYVRTDSGGVPISHARSVNNTVWNDEWHHVAWVQHDAGGSAKARLYIDGVVDIPTLNAAYPVNVNNSALGAYARLSPNVFFTGLVDEVAIWERPLSPEEVALLANSYITNPPSRLTPLAVNSFKSDLPAVVKGDSTVLRWDVPANATQVLIDPLGDVTSMTLAGIGTTNVILTKTTSFVLTVKRGAEQVKATNTVGVIDGVAADWSLLDNFDLYNAGSLGANGWWVDVAGGNSVSVVVAPNANRLAKTVFATSGAYLPLRGLTVGANESRTLFFRLMVPPVSLPDVIRQYVGLTDKPGNFVNQYQANIGPAVRPTVNDPSQNPGDWLLAAVNMPASSPTYATEILQTDAVYMVWIDVTNVFIGDRAFENMDVFSVHLQKEGDESRTTLFENFVSDRNLTLDDPLTGGLPTDNLNRLYLCGVGADSALFDDFYLSKSGYNSTVPRPFGYSGGALPAITIRRVGAQLEILWSAGFLQEAPSLTGAWTDVPGANAPSHVVTPGGVSKYFRTRN
jgi:hypothetical protein